MNRFFSLSLLWLLGIALAITAGRCVGEESGWRAGVAAVVITPEENMWMAGYAARNRPSEGKVQDLFAKALALEDAQGRQLVIVTMDLIGVPRALRDAVEEQARQRYKLDRAALLLNASHTHCGPELRATKAALLGLPPERAEQCTRYMEQLQAKLVDLIGAALDDLRPAQLHYTAARCGFAMNRRLPTDSGIRNAPNRFGPVDHEVPVLRVADGQGELRALLFGYTCHNTTLSFYQFCGDYAGYAQEYLEQAHPGVRAMFLTGCGGDQNPQPRRTLELAQQHGRALANAVEAALLAQLQPVDPQLRAAWEFVDLEFADPPTREVLLRMAESSSDIDRRRAAHLLDQLEKDGRLMRTYPYPVQVIALGDDVLLVALGGEVVVDYSLRLKSQLHTSPTAAVWVAGYSNDVMAYIPSLRVLQEGGYEGGAAMRYTLLPGPWAPSIEQRIVGAVMRLAEQIGWQK